jgi:hypothetical protein
MAHKDMTHGTCHADLIPLSGEIYFRDRGIMAAV